MAVPMQPDDPAYWMLECGRRDPSWRSKKAVHHDDCYICEDEEFEVMGLPLCRPCPECDVGDSTGAIQPGHIPADDDICSDCGRSDR